MENDLVSKREIQLNGVSPGAITGVQLFVYQVIVPSIMAMITVIVVTRECFFCLIGCPQMISVVELHQNHTSLLQAVV